MKKRLMATLLFLVVVAMLVSCTGGDSGEAQQQNLSETNPDIAAAVEQSKEYVENMYSDENMTVTVYAKGNSVVYKIKSDFKQEDVEIASNAVYDNVVEALERAKTQLPELESFIYEYYNLDDQLICSEEYK